MPSALRMNPSRVPLALRMKLRHRTRLLELNMKMRSLRMLLDFLPPKLRLRMATLLLELSVSLKMLLEHSGDEMAIWAAIRTNGRSTHGDASSAFHLAD